jgi:hypothetical protein
VGIANALVGLGAGLLLGLLLDLPGAPAQRGVAVGGVAALLAGGVWLLLDRDLGDVALALLAGLLLALGSGLVARLGSGLAAPRRRDGRRDRG